MVDVVSEAIWIRQPQAVWSGNDKDAGGGIVVERDKIVELVANGQTPTRPYSQVFDASEHVLLPGLINAHHHFYQTLTRALPAAINKRLFPWLKTLYPVWARLGEKQMAVASRLAMVELLMSGCTTASDHHYLFTDALGDAIDIQLDEATRLGMRVVLTRGSMSLGQDQGGLPPNSTVQSESTILADSERLVSQYHQSGEGAMQQIALAPCSPFSVSRELMKETASLARRMGVRLHTHLAETADENAYCEREFGLRPLDYLEDCGWLSSDVWLAHGIHFSDSELKRLGKAGTGICHCPSSNMMLASGICRGIELEAAGATVGLGVDGSASNDGSSMIAELRQALLIHRLRYDADEVTHIDTLRWATSGSAACLGRNDIGELDVGKQADLALFRLDELRFSGAGDPIAALVLCGAQSADAVMIGGCWRVRGGQALGVDIAALRAEHQQAARQLQQAL